MDHFVARCGCGALVRLPSLKARAYSVRCEACIGRERAQAKTMRDGGTFAKAYPGLAKWADLELPKAMPAGLPTKARMDLLQFPTMEERELLESRYRELMGREKNARIDACAHDFGNDIRVEVCLKCRASRSVIATRMERAAKTPLDVARLNVFRLESQLYSARLNGAPLYEQDGIGECLDEARKELGKLERVRG